MIRLLSDMPPGVLGLEAVDDIGKQDYENVFVPAVEATIAEHGKARLVYVLGHESTSTKRMRSGRTSSSACATLARSRGSPSSPMRAGGPAIKVFSVLWPGKARAFPLAELDAAKRWAADDTER